MLKKLVKYGNSNALILDKALLELLNINEGSVVKIKTDGTSLIITPENSSDSATISPSVVPQELFSQALKQQFNKTTQNLELLPVYLQKLQAVFQKYEKSFKKLEATEFKKAVQELEQIHGKDQKNPRYTKAVSLLCNHYAPELQQMEEEIKEVSRQYASADYQYTDAENNGALTAATVNFKKTHEKYGHLFPKLAQLQENPEYIHESALLAEKYQLTKNSPAYMQEQVELIARYIPEYTAYQEEIKSIAENCK